MLNFAVQWIVETWEIVVEAGPWLLFGFVLAGFVHLLLPVGKVTAHLGKPGLAGVVKASLLGIPLPLCSCSVIPVASSLRKQGAGRGAFVSFLISTPETGVDSIALSYALLGPFLAIVRPVAAFVTALTAGFLVDQIDRAGPPRDDTSRNNCCGDSCCEAAAPKVIDSCAINSCSCSDEDDGKANAGLSAKMMAALRYGLVDLFADLAMWLTVGFLLAGLVSAAIPEGFLERSIGSGLGAMLLMVLLGLPLYICATSSTPVAAALIANGLSPGAALVLMLVGPATNVATMVIVARDAGRAGLTIYISTIAVIAVLFGLAIDAAVVSLPAHVIGLPIHGSHEPTPLALAAAIVLIICTLNGMRIHFSRKTQPPACGV
ncbi:MAG: SO_0444 family Cu/Zn efflux transporter [Phycisphaerales bacterium]|nr:MAG: SO_0444 family Cu/Zn efflux transporter [Phycisphaerales bacterium]